MHDGKVQQVGTPESLYERPANLFVADFLGKMNFFPGKVESAHRFVTDKGFALAVTVRPPAAGEPACARSGSCCSGSRPARTPWPG